MSFWIRVRSGARRRLKESLTPLLRLPGLVRLVRFLYAGEPARVSPAPHKGGPPSVNLDVVLQRATSLREFLEAPQLVDAYYVALRQYFGGNLLRRDSFLAVLAQLRALVQAVPELRESVWRGAEEGGEFVIRTVSLRSGRTLNVSLWRAYRVQWTETLKRLCGDPAAERMPEIQQECLRTLERLADETRRWDVRLEAENARRRMRTKEKLIARNDFYREFQKNPNLRRIAAFYLFTHLMSRRSVYLYSMTDADLLLEFLHDLRQHPSQVLPLEARPVPGLLAVIRNLVPEPRLLLNDLVLFPHGDPVRGRHAHGGDPRADYVTRCVRPFHTLWTGAINGDCLGGAPNYLGEISQRRWASSILEGTLNHFVERNGRYHGFVRCVPFRGGDGVVVGSLELGAPGLADKVRIEPTATEVPKPAVLFDLWYPQYARRLPADWKGAMVSKSRSIDVAQMKEVILASPHYLFGEPLGEASRFALVDRGADRLARALPPSATATRYCDGMITDATIRDAGDMTRLVPLMPEAVGGEDFERRLGALREAELRRIKDYLGAALETGDARERRGGAGPA